MIIRVVYPKEDVFMTISKENLFEVKYFTPSDKIEAISDIKNSLMVTNDTITISTYDSYVLNLVIEKCLTDPTLELEIWYKGEKIEYDDLYFTHDYEPYSDLRKVNERIVELRMLKLEIGD